MLKSSIEIVVTYAGVECAVGVEPITVGDAGIEEEKAVADGVVAFKAKLGSHDAVGLGIAENGAVIHNGELVFLEDNTPDIIGENAAAVTGAVEDNIAHAYHAFHALVAAFGIDDMAEPVKLVFVVVTYTGFDKPSGGITDVDAAVFGVPVYIGRKGLGKGADGDIQHAVHVEKTFFEIDISVVDAEIVIMKVEDKCYIRAADA